MDDSKLKLNPDKTEFIMFGSPSQPNKVSHGIQNNILGNFLTRVGSVRNLGVLFYSTLSFSYQVA
jgi:hypothetical protein